MLNWNWQTSSDSVNCPWSNTNTTTLCTRTIRSSFHLLWLFISLVTSLPCVIVFMYNWSRTKNTQLLLHSILMASLSLRTFFSVLVESEIILKSIECDNDVYNSLLTNGPGCKTIASLEVVISNIVVSMWLMETIYIHLFVLNAFLPPAKTTVIKYLFSLVGIGVVTSVLWTILMLLFHDEMCWLCRDSNYKWINDSIRLVMLLAQILLLCNVIRIFCTHPPGSTTLQVLPTRFTTHMLLVVTPIFMLQIIFSTVQPGTTVCHSSTYYAYYLIDGLQAGVVSLVLFYLDHEVQKAGKKAWKQIRIRAIGWCARRRDRKWLRRHKNNNDIDLTMFDDTLEEGPSRDVDTTDSDDNILDLDETEGDTNESHA